MIPWESFPPDFRERMEAVGLELSRQGEPVQVIVTLREGADLDEMARKAARAMRRS